MVQIVNKSNFIQSSFFDYEARAPVGGFKGRLPVEMFKTLDAL